MVNPNGDPTSTSSSRLTIVDAAGIFLLCVFLLIVSYFRSRHRMFWGDEMMGSFVLKQPTWSGLLRWWNAGIDSSGIWFYVLGRPWIALFGASEVSLREFSAVGIAAAVSVFWIAARRFYSVLPVAAATLFFIASSPILRWQLANGRTYGIFMLACAVLLYLIVRGQDEDATRPTPLFLLATFAAYAFLAGSHILGLLYSAAFLGIQIALDLYSRRLRPLLYLSAACATGLVVFFSSVNIKATVALGKPSFWTVRPRFRDLLTSHVLVNHRVFAVLGILILLTALFFQVRRLRMPVYIIFLGFVALYLLFFAISRVSTSIYVDRYLMPFYFAEVFLLCELLTQLHDAKAPWPRLRAGLPFLILLLAVPEFFLPRFQVLWFPFTDYTNDMLAALPPGLPVVDTDPGSFIEVEFYHRGAIGRPWLFPVDWEVALDHANTGGVSGYHELDNFKTFGIYADDILPGADILAHNREFIVLSTKPDLWLEHRILANPHFTATRIGTFRSSVNAMDGNSFGIWLVKAL